ncbi:hypothetical protein AHF37_03235 [Paragonimus kellicotti]|nr:hypothetical protein AHF37_03235 [Paragonimus kellicotti]
MVFPTGSSKIVGVTDGARTATSDSTEVMEHAESKNLFRLQSSVNGISHQLINFHVVISMHNKAIVTIRFYY